MPLDVDGAYTPADLADASRTELLEYIGNLNAAAKRMDAKHLAWALRHAQLNQAVSEIERRELVRIATA